MQFHQKCWDFVGDGWKFSAGGIDREVVLCMQWPVLKKYHMDWLFSGGATVVIKFGLVKELRAHKISHHRAQAVKDTV